MSYPTGERVFHRTQIGHETTPGTPVAATAQLNGQSGAIIDLDRAPDDLQEDYGGIAGARTGRGSWGVRRATMPFTGAVRFEDIHQHFQAGIAGGVTAVPTHTAAVQTWTFTKDELATTLISQTIEDGDNVQTYQMPFSLLTDIKLAFANLGAPAASGWTLNETWIGQDKIAIGGLSSAASPTAAETVMGHLTRAYLGSTATAFAGLSELVGLNAMDVTIPTGVVPRKWGDASDLYNTIGRMPTKPTGNFTFYQLAATKTGLFDVWQTAGSVVQENRLRILARGSLLFGTNEVQTITLTGGPTGGTFTLTFGAQTTTAIPYNATGATVQAALRLLSSVGPYGCVVTGAAGGPYVVTMAGALAYLASNPITASGASLTGPGAPYTVTIVDTTPGVAGEYKSLIIDGRIRFVTMPVQDSNGATVYATTARYVYDATLGTDVQITVVNAIPTLI